MTMQAHIGSFRIWQRVHVRSRRRKIAQNRSHSAVNDQARVPGLIRIADLLVVVGVGIAAAWLDAGHRSPIPPADWLKIVLAALLFVNYLDLGRSYRFKTLNNAISQTRKVSLAWLGTVASIKASQFAMTGIATIDANRLRSWTMVWFFGVWLVALVMRIVVWLWIEHERRKGRWTLKIAIAGSGTPAFDLSRRLASNGSRDVEIVGIFVDRSCPLQSTRTVDDLYDLANSEQIDEILIALPWQSEMELNAAVRKLCMLPVDVKIYAGAPGLALAGNEIDSIALPMLPVQRRPLVGWGGPLKRMEDIILVSLLLCALAPLFLVIALLIKLDSRGPIFFLQERFGFNNDKIRIFKFRTMRHNLEPDPMVLQARPNDPRITRIGAFLRRTSLDELPQLFNVLGGSMSLIGPRPHATIHNKRYGRLIDGYLGRHRMKPGITGWAQVNGHRGETSTIEKMRLRLQHDLYYIDNWSLLLDLKILAMTVPAVIRGQNAY